MMGSDLRDVTSQAGSVGVEVEPLDVAGVADMAEGVALAELAEALGIPR
jgi:hypothetical protein